MTATARLARASAALLLCCLAAALWPAQGSATSLMVEHFRGHPSAYIAAGHMGATYARQIVEHGSGSWGSFDWDSDVTPFVQNAITYEMEPYLTLSTTGTRPTIAQFTQWCGEAAFRYNGVGGKPLVRNYSVMNEPNSDGYSGATYRLYYAACRAVIKATVSDANVYVGEIEAGSPGGCAFLDDTLPRSPSPALQTEGVAIHPYQYTTRPDTALADDCRGIGNLSDWTSAITTAATAGRIVKPGGGTPPLLVSEFGYCTERPPIPDGVPAAQAACPQRLDGLRNKLDEQTRAAWIEQAFDLAEQNGVAIFDYHGLMKREVGNFTGSPGGLLWESGIIENPSGAWTPSVDALRRATGVQSAGAAVSPATNVGTRSARLNGTVTASRFRTTWWFEYGRPGGAVLRTPAQTLAGGSGATAVSADVAGLGMGSVYRFRLVVDSRSGGGESGDLSFTTGTDPHVAFVDSAVGDTLTEWSATGEPGWTQWGLFGGRVAAGTRPASIVIDGVPRVYFVDADRGNSLTEWMLFSTGWSERPMVTPPVSAGTSPAVVAIDGQPHVYFANSARGGQLSERVWGARGWTQNDIVGGRVASGTAPAAIQIGGVPRVYITDGDKGNTLTEFMPLSGSWSERPMYADAAKAGSSPAAVAVDGQPRVYFANAARGDRVSERAWGARGWAQTDLASGRVAPGTGLAAIQIGDVPRVYLVDADKGNTLTEFMPLSGSWSERPMYGDRVTAGSSPSVTVVGGMPEVVFASADKLDTLVERRWTAAGWSQSLLSAGSIGAGSSPNVVVINGEPQVFFVDVANGSTISRALWETEPGWKQRLLLSKRAMPGTSPAVVRIGETAYVFFADHDSNGALTLWRWEPGNGWTERPLFGGAVANGTSPTALVVDGQPRVYFSDANNGGEITERRLNDNWRQRRLRGDAVAAGSTPAAIVLGDRPRIYFADADGGTITELRETADLNDDGENVWLQQRFFQDRAASGTKPVAVVDGGTPHVFFVSADRGDSLAEWTISSGGWTVRALCSGRPLCDGRVVSGSSPAATVNAAGEVVVVAGDQSNLNGALMSWTLKPSGWTTEPLFHDAVAAGTSPSIAVSGATTHVYFASATKFRTLYQLSWNVRSGWQGAALWGHALAAGTSPAGW